MQKFLDWLTDQGLGALGRFIPFILILIVGLIVIKIVTVIVNKTLTKSKLEKAAHGMICGLIRIVLFILLGLMAASSLGIDVTGVVALASIASLAVSLALQDLLSNLVGGFTLVYTHPFSSGDYVEIAGQSGTVQEIGMTYTKLATPDNKIVSIPNSAVVAAQIVNYTVTGTRRAEILVSASYDVPTQKVLDALVLAGTVDNALLDPAPKAVISTYGDSAIQYSLRVWAKTDDFWDVYFLVNQRVKTIFDEQDITMTYPHLNVHLHQ